MREYLFIDSNFVEQFNAQNKDPVKDKFRWKVKFGLFGQGLEIENEDEAGNKNPKIDNLEFLINKCIDRTHSRIDSPFDHDDPNELHKFYEETTYASNGFLRNKFLENLGIDALKIWLSEGAVSKQPDSVPTHLLLIECFTADFGRAASVSGYSALHLLTEAIKHDAGADSVGISRPDRVGGIADVVERIVDGRESDEKRLVEFSQNLRNALTNFGCVLAPPQRIETMYRLRSACMEKNYNFAVGYPIYIARAHAT